MQFDKITALLVTICSMISFQSGQGDRHLNLNQAKAKTKDVKTHKNKQELKTDTMAPHFKQILTSTEP